MMALRIDQIRTDGGTQSRAAINEATVAEYAEAMADENTVFPPVVVYFDGRDHWLADGFHRLEAWKRIGRTEIPVDVRQGDRRRAILHSVAANTAHGLRRTNEDKRRAVLTLLEDDEWRQWSDSEIARRCVVSQPFVGKMREALTQNVLSEAPTETRTYTTKHGTEAAMKTAKIGKTDRGLSECIQEAESRQVPVKPAEPSSADQEVATPVEPAAADPHAAERRALAKLTTEALIDDVIGLRADLAEAREKLRAVTQERDDLKTQLAEFRTDDLGRALGNAQRRENELRGRLGEIAEQLAREKRRANYFEKMTIALQVKLEMQEIPLGPPA